MYLSPFLPVSSRLRAIAFSFFGFVIPVLFVALGIWLCKLGIDIVRNVTPRESLERAAQASMVYIALFILELIGAGYSLILLLIAPNPFTGMVLAILIGLIFLRMIYNIPPAVILYIDSRLK